MNTPNIPFEPWPKIPRLMKDIVITEKIDGTNAGIYVDPAECLAGHGPEDAKVYAASRKRWITPENDNYGFARWVEKNAATLVVDLGPGMHFGEWWGQGIQRGYGLDEKRFSLFNIRKWGAQDKNTDPRCERKGSHIESKGERVCACREERCEAQFETSRLGVVPLLYEGPFEPEETKCGLVLDGPPWVHCMKHLRNDGSVAAPGFMNPEGIIVYHTAAAQAFKVVISGEAI